MKLQTAMHSAINNATGLVKLNDEGSELDVGLCTEAMKRLRKALGTVAAAGQPESSPVVAKAKQLLDTLNVLHYPGRKPYPVASLRHRFMIIKHNVFIYFPPEIAILFCMHIIIIHSYLAFRCMNITYKYN